MNDQSSTNNSKSIRAVSSRLAKSKLRSYKTAATDSDQATQSLKSNDYFVNDCWNKIGVSGDSSCHQLKTVIHCRNCPVYSAAGRALLQREAPEGYLEEWTNLLSQTWQKKSTTHKVNASSTADTNFSSEATAVNAQVSLPAMIFRLGEEWLALPVWVVKEVTQPCPIHTLPHRSNDILLGIVNIRGEILICISLSRLLDLPKLDPKIQNSKFTNRTNPVVYQRMVVIEIQENKWVFMVDEIYSVQRYNSNELSDPPAVISKTPDTYTKSIINWNNKKVNYLNHELLFYELLFYTLNRT